MINIDFSWAVALYLIFLVSLMLLVWLGKNKEKDKDLSLSPECIWFCSICTYTYVNTKEESISVCPRCGSYNKK